MDFWKHWMACNLFFFCLWEVFKHSFWQLYAWVQCIVIIFSPSPFIFSSFLISLSPTSCLVLCLSLCLSVSLSVSSLPPPSLPSLTEFYYSCLWVLGKELLIGIQACASGLYHLRKWWLFPCHKLPSEEWCLLGAFPIHDGVLMFYP